MTGSDERGNIVSRSGSRWIAYSLPLFIKTVDPPLYSTYRFLEKFLLIVSLGVNFFQVRFQAFQIF